MLHSCILLLFLSAPIPTPLPATAITQVTVVDAAGGPSRGGMTVVVRGDRIESVGPGPAPAGALTVDGRGKFLIPGLWDMHVHLSLATSSALPLLIANGVTSVRDLGSHLPQIEGWRARIAAGELVGPRISRAGPILNGKAFNQYQMVSGTPEQTRGVARALHHVGVDVLKTHRRMPRESYFALVAEAAALGIPLVGHIPMTVTPEEASDARQQTIEHVETLFEGTFGAALQGPLPEAIRAWRAAAAPPLFARFVKNGTALTPTLVAYRTLVTAMDPASPPDPRQRYVAASARKAMTERPPLSAADLAEMKAPLGEFREVVRALNRAGVTLLAGSDIAGPLVPGFTLHDELALLVEAGLTPLQALQAATVNPAKLMGRAGELGTIEAGKLADLVLLDADPLQDITNTTRIDAVVTNGRLLRRPQLDALLRDAEALAARQ